MNKIENFTLHNNRGDSVLNSNLEKWCDPTNPSNDIFGPVIRYSWVVDGVNYNKYNQPPRLILNELPDASGFIGFEKGWEPDNCLLFDSIGDERMRLTVPWQLTESKNPESQKSPTSFAGVGAPCVNPSTGCLGLFGVDAWVEHAGMYYFELNYHSGQFLWGKEIRD